jgi:hypothetical protein
MFFAPIRTVIKLNAILFNPIYRLALIVDFSLAPEANRLLGQFIRLRSKGVDLSTERVIFRHERFFRVAEKGLRGLLDHINAVGLASPTLLYFLCISIIVKVGCCYASSVAFHMFFTHIRTVIKP